MKIIFITLLYFTIPFAIAQDKYNNYYQEINNQTDNNIKIDGLCKLGLKCNDTIKAFKYLDEAFAVAKNANLQDAILNIEIKKAYQYYKTNNPIKCEKLVSKVVQSINKIKISKFDAETLYFLGTIEDNNSKALNYFFKGIAVAKKNNDFTLLSKICYSISTLYSNVEEVAFMKKYVDFALFYSKKANSFDSRIFADLALGNYYTKLYQAKNDIDYLNQTIDLYTKTQKYIEANIPKYVFTKQMPYVFINLANAYSLSGIKKHETQFLQTLTLAERYGQELNSKSTLNSAIGLRGEYYFSQKNYPKAIETFKNGLKMANQFDDNLLSIAFCESLNKCFDATNDFENYKKYENLKFEFFQNHFDQTKTKEVILAEERFKNEKKEIKIKTLEKENNLKTDLFWITLSLLFISIVLIIVFYFYTKTNKKLATEKQFSLELSYKIKENEIQKILIEKELTEQQKNKIQLQLVNNLMQLKDKNVLLTNLKDISESKSISKIINDNLSFDEKIDFYSNQLIDENVLFFKKLKEKSNDTLTTLDQKYCIYFMNGLETKEIANKLNIEAKSVRMTRYRIKKKLNLSEKEDLVGFLKSLSC